MTLPDRIDKALDGKKMNYADLARHLYPEGKAWRCATKGGPPGCYMALSAGLRRGGFYVDLRGVGPGNRIVHPRRKS
jgi:hypothetical protein